MFKKAGIGILIIVFILIILTLILVQKDTEDSLYLNGDETHMIARINQGISVLGIDLIPTEVIEDSRCPYDVMCIQDGTVRVQALIFDEDGPGVGRYTQTFTLGEPITTAIHEITLTDVKPEQKVEGISPLEYQFRFDVRIR